MPADPIRFVPLLPSLVDEVLADRRHSAVLSLYAGRADAAAYHVACTAEAFAGLVPDGEGGLRAVGMAGLLRPWSGRAQAWALFNDVPRRCWPAITAKVRQVFAAAEAGGVRRIEATVDPWHPAACRWAARLGLKAYGLLERYTPDDRTLIGVARVTPHALPGTQEKAA